MSVVREVEVNGYRVNLDLSEQVLKLEIPETDSYTSVDRSGSVILSPPLPDYAFPSAATLLFKAKQFDDGLMAAVELVTQQGLGQFPGKQKFLLSLARELSSGSSRPEFEALGIVAAACELGGAPIAELPTSPEAISIVREFRHSLNKSKPISFYTWNEQLKAIFQQDRLLQQELEPPLAESLNRALERTTGAMSTYSTILQLAAKLTNPADRRSILDDVPSELHRARPSVDYPRFFPPSRSHEVDLLEELYGNTRIPDGFDLMTEFISRVQDGTLSLNLREDSGWYDYHLCSLEPLLLPDQMSEAPRLSLNSHYRRYREDVFRGAFALARETHVKQLRGGYGGGGRRRDRVRILPLVPNLRVEPVPSLYRRKAIASRFVGSVLEDFFGGEALEQLHRLTADGPVELNLAAEWKRMEKLFAGAYLVSCEDIGLVAEAEFITDVSASRDEFSSWSQKLSKDEDLFRDARMMVPVFYDEGREKWKVWVFLGWDTRKLWVRYEREPKVLGSHRTEQLKGQPNEQIRWQFTMETHSLPMPVVAEAHVGEVMNRDEFRKFCDKYRTKESILQNLL